MSGLIESATAIMRASERRLEITAHNVANISTPGYKRQHAFARLLAGADPAQMPTSDIAIRRDFAQGAMRETSNPLDLAISGPGFFQLQAGDRILYSRQGHFSLGADGTVVTPQGHRLQQAGGGDLILERLEGVSFEQDGTVLSDGVPIARIDLFGGDPAALQAIGESHFADPENVMSALDNMVLRQGVVENSNVDLGDEMVGMTAAVRQSETGARLVQVWDDLIGRALTTLGNSR